jgi:hypothetical protein
VPADQVGRHVRLNGVQPHGIPDGIVQGQGDEIDLHHAGKMLSKITTKRIEIPLSSNRLRHFQEALIPLRKTFTGRSGWPIHSRAVWRINQQRLKRRLVERPRDESRCPSKRLVRPVAEWRSLGVLTLAQRHFFGFIDGKFNRLDAGSCMRSVTKWLIP